jgi:4-carboxymuconolactone decarboxylase
MYDRLRVNIAALHPALDSWMVVEGYGKVLGRPQLDLMRRELCIVAACAVAKQDRQLQSHLHGALNVRATPEQVAGALTAVGEMVGKAGLARALAMLKRVLGK